MCLKIRGSESPLAFGLPIEIKHVNRIPASPTSFKMTHFWWVASLAPVFRRMVLQLVRYLLCCCLHSTTLPPRTRSTSHLPRYRVCAMPQQYLCAEEEWWRPGWSCWWTLVDSCVAILSCAEGKKRWPEPCVLDVITLWSLWTFVKYCQANQSSWLFPLIILRYLGALRWIKD